MSVKMKKEFNVREFNFNDVFELASIVNKIDIKLDPKELVGKPVKIIGFMVMDRISSQCPNVKHDIYKFVGNICGLKAEEVSKLTFKEMKELFIKVKEVNDLEDFFTQAMSLVTTMN